MRFQKSAMMAKKLSVHNVRMQSGEGEEGGDAGELVAARDIRFTQIALTKNQFNELFGSEIADRFFFDYGTTPPKPAQDNVGTIWLDQAYKDVYGAIIFGVSKKELDFEGGKIRNISVKVKNERAYGLMSLTLTAVLPRKVDTLDLEEFFGKVVTLNLSFAAIDEEAAKENTDNQGKLQLDGGADPDEDNGDDDDSDKPSRRKSDVDETRPH